MNLERLNQAIAVMKRAGKVFMGDFQTGSVSVVATDEITLHTCGNSACFAGWLAVSPEFQAAGGVVGFDGSPLYKYSMLGGSSVAEWLETDNTTAIELLVYGEARHDNFNTDYLDEHGIEYQEIGNHHYELVGWENYNAQDVIKYLEALKSL